MAAPGDEKDRMAPADEAQTALLKEGATVETLPSDPTVVPGAGGARTSLRGEAIGRYLLGEPVGEGGMGVVYAAYDPQLDRAIAVKLVRVEGADARTRDEARARLLREAQAMARLSHPNVVTVYDAGVWKDRVFLAMELVRGATTASQWLRDRPRSIREIIRVFVEAGRGIAAAHAAGIVHRDVKPANILVDESGHARITDFGIARADDMTETVELGGIESPNLTAVGRLVGTPAYMAPEVLFGGRGDARSDEFGFCVALHVALYGVRPYPDNRIRESALVEVIAAPPGTKVPPEVRRVLLRGLALRPDDRYPSMDELLADLERTSTRPRAIAIASAAAGVAVIAMAFAAVRGGGTGLCSDAAPLRGVWDSGTQGAIERAFRANDPAGSEIWGRAKSGLDRTAAEWSGALAGACRVPEEGSRLLRVACLEKQRDRLRMLTGVLRSADAEVIAHASTAAATIPRAAECDDVRGISLTSKLPEAPDRRREIAALELRIAEASVQADAGKYAEALSSLESTSTRAAAIGFRPLEAEALFALGGAQYDAGKTADSTATLSRAVLAAEAAGDDRLAARAAARLANNASLIGDAGGRDAWLARARAILERLGPDDRAEGDVTLAAAWAAYDDGRRDESLALAQRSAALRSKLLGPGHPETLRAGYVIAIALTMLGRFDEAIAKYDETVRQFDASLGLQHPGASGILTSEAFLLMRLGRFAEADAALARAVPLAEKFERDTPQRALAYLALALLRLRQNRLDDALQNIHLAEEAARASSGEHSGNYLVAVGVEGEIRLARHDVPGALSVLERMKGNADAETNAVIAEALLAAGRSRDALQMLELASTQLPGETHYPGIAARVRFDLARVLLLTGGDRARARDLALLARRELALLAWQRDRLDEVDRWLADPRNAPRR